MKYPYTIRYRNEHEITIFSPPTDLPEPQLTDNALAILDDRYIKKDDNVQLLETPKQLFWRVAKFVSYGNASYGIGADDRHRLAEEYYEMMTKGIFLPNTPTLVSAGRYGTDNAQLAACYVLPIEDSLVEGEASIGMTLLNTFKIHQSGGGTGFSFSFLRPEGSSVGGHGGVASGPISFMRMYNAATEEVKQGGVRRGANMGVLSVHHPDIVKFVDAKAQSDKIGETGPLGNFNISVAATDAFMRAVKEEGYFNLINLKNNGLVGSLKAKDIFDKIIYNAWLYGDPGIFFVDTANKSFANPIKGWRIKATNPCGEQPIYDNDACNLGSIRLTAFWKNAKGSWKKQFDWKRFAKIIHLAVRFLDDVITVCTYPLPKITKLVDSLRRIGLGPMGLADLLQLMEIPYDSEEALIVSKEIAQFFKREAIVASCLLAEERGAFPLFESSIYGDNSKPRRNATVTTVAPTGSLSRLADCEGGIEPTISYCYEHQLQNLKFVNNTVRRVLERKDIWNDKVKKEIQKTGRVSQIIGLSDKIRSIFKTGGEIDPEVHVEMQAVWQNNFSESGVSKTVNMPKSATVEDVARAFWKAYESGCMGITVFREGCARAPMMKNPKEQVKRGKIIRPFEVSGVTFKIPTPHDQAYFTLNIDEEIDFLEGFLNIGKAGSDLAELTEMGMRLFSLIGRRTDGSVKEKLAELIKQLRDIGGKKELGPDDEKLIRGVSDGIAFCCQLTYDKLYSADSNKEGNKERASGMFCPECQGSLVFVEGCRGGKCLKCGFSSC